jgi:pimeloyl-ACP methyl ester carboxylesterase
MKLLTMVATALLLSAAISGCGATTPLLAAQHDLVSKAMALGAGKLTGRGIQQGGLLLGGELQGRQFALAIPRHWNGEALLFAHGYTAPGSSIAVAHNPLEEKAVGKLLELAYEQGLAVGYSAYDKAGIGVKSGVENTLRLKHFVGALGASKVFISGASMGGNIVMALIEDHPGSFVGALSVCGLVDDWESAVRQMIDMRAAYDFYTAGTAYELPGSHDIERSALPMELPSYLGLLQLPYGWLQIERMARPIVKLFKAAKKDPAGSEAMTIRNVAAISGVEPEMASFLFPILTIALGMDDLQSSFGGSVYDNIAKVYKLPWLSEADTIALNHGIARIGADPGAVAFARQWHQSSGRFTTPLVTMHNRIDSLAAYSHNQVLAERVQAAGNRQNLVRITVPPMRFEIPTTGETGYSHCGFTLQQQALAWKTLHDWVDSGGQRPADIVLN